MDFNKRIYFYCYPQGTPDKAGYQHSIVCLGEGLKELGIEFYSNINYWRLSPESEAFLFNYNTDVTIDDCSIVVLNDDWISYGLELPKDLFKSERKYLTVYIDHSDGVVTKSWNKEFRKFDFIFKSHYNSKIEYPANFYPWAFGLSNRIINETKDIGDFNNRTKRILVNFRVNHPLRKKISSNFFPLVKEIFQIDDSTDDYKNIPADSYHYLQWMQTGRRHYPCYYDRLKKSIASASFGGNFVTPYLRNQASKIARMLNKIMMYYGVETNRILQFDSWIFWESLAAGCVTFHIDFKKYGCLLPVMPENWKHYIGIDLRDISKAVNKIKENPEILEQISLEGRNWALKNYNPKTTAERFLDIINKNYYKCS